MPDFATGDAGDGAFPGEQGRSTAAALTRGYLWGRGIVCCIRTVGQEVSEIVRLFTRHGPTPPHRPALRGPIPS